MSEASSRRWAPQNPVLVGLEEQSKPDMLVTLAKDKRHLPLFYNLHSALAEMQSTDPEQAAQNVTMLQMHLQSWLQTLQDKEDVAADEVKEQVQEALRLASGGTVDPPNPVFAPSTPTPEPTFPVHMIGTGEEPALIDMQHLFLDKCKGGDWSAVKTMAESDDRLVNCTPSDRWSALMWASKTGNEQMIRWLLDKGADILYRNPKYGGCKDVSHADVKQILEQEMIRARSVRR